MFDVLVESTSQRRGARMWTYFAISSFVWLGIFAGVAVAGVMAYDARLDAEFGDLGLVAFVPPSAPPPRAERPQPDSASSQPNQFISRDEAPTTIAPPRAVLPATGPSTNGVPGGGDNGALGGIPGGTGTDPLGIPGGSGPAGPVTPIVDPPPAPAPEPQTPPKRMVSKGPITGLAIKRVVPPYPPMAERAGVTGTVVVEVIVSEEGNVQSVRTISGNPLLRDAAERAARGWKFTPTTLSNVPVKVVGTITFTFKKP